MLIFFRCFVVKGIFSKISKGIKNIKFYNHDNNYHELQFTFTHLFNKNKQQAPTTILF